MGGKWKIRRQSVTFQVGLVGVSHSSPMDLPRLQTTTLCAYNRSRNHLSKWSNSECDAIIPHSTAAEKSQKCCQSYSNTEMGRISRCLTDINWIRTLHIWDLNGILPMGHRVKSRGVALNVLNLSENERTCLFFI